MSNERVDITLAGVALSEAVPEALVLQVRRPLLGARRDTFVDVPGRESAWTFTEQPGDRTLSVEIDLEATSFDARRSSVVALADWADTLAGRVPLIVEDQPDRYWDAILQSPPEVVELLIYGSVVLDFRVGPYASSLEVSTETFSGSGGNISHSWNAPDELFAYPIIEITGRGGNLDSPTVTLNDDSLSIVRNYAEDETLTINGISYVVTSGTSDDENLTGAWDPGSVTMSRVAGSFGLIVPGANTFEMSYDGAATSVDIVITWRRRFR